MQILDVCCLIITYNPDENLFNLVNNISCQVNKIIVVDNNSVGSGMEIIHKVRDFEKVNLILNNENMGIAKALNQGILFAAEMKFNWVITFDQDSLPHENIIERLSEIYSFYPKKDQIGAIGINYSHQYIKTILPAIDQPRFRKKDYLITSGCLLSVKAFMKIGGFREDFFIDNVDLEYSLRLTKNGKISLISKEIGMFHKAGSPITKKIFGITIKSSNHNSSRRYYMARNHVILSKEYLFVNPYFIAKLNFFFFRSLFLLLLVDDDKKARFFASIKGLFDGIFYSSKLKKLAV